MIPGIREAVIDALTSPQAVDERRLASILDAAADAVLICAEDGRIVFFNKACERLFGVAADDIIGRHARVLLPQASREAEVDRWESLFQPSRTRNAVWLRAFDGRAVPAEVTVSSSATSAGRHYLLVVREGADYRTDGAGDRADDDEQADFSRSAPAAAMENLGGALAHKLNQPLTAVILYLQAVERAYSRETGGNGLPEKVASILEKAVREAERASSLLQRIRQTRKLGESLPQPSDLNQALEDALGRNGFLDGRRVAIDRLLTPRLPPVGVARTELQQALSALIRGAVKAAGNGNGGGLRLTTRRVGDHAAVVAELPPSADHGEFASNCAESTDGRRNCENDLAIARAIAHDHGGELTVDGDGRDRGTRFTLRLPLLAEQCRRFDGNKEDG